MKKCLYSYVIFFIVGLFSFVTSASASNSISKINMDIYLDSSGNAHVEETWYATLSNGTEGYKPYYNLGESTIQNFKVLMDGEPFTYQSLWNTDDNFDSKAYKNGINYISNGVELCWGISDYGYHEYELQYTITNFVANLTDADMIYWTLIPYELSSKPGNVEIKTHADQPFEDSLDVWGYGNYGGLAYVSDGAIYMSSDGVLETNEYMTLLVKFPQNTFSTQNVLDHDFNYYLNMANEGAKKYEPSLWDKFVEILPLILVGLIFILTFVVIFFSSIKLSDTVLLGIKRIYLPKNKKLPKDLPYFREIPCQGKLEEAYWVTSLYSMNKRKNDVLGSYLLKWIRDEYITVQKVMKDGILKDKEEQHLILKSIQEVQLSDTEKRLYDMLLSASKDGILEPKEFEKWCKDHYEEFFDWFDDLLDSVSIKYQQENKLFETSYKKYGMKIQNLTINDSIMEDAKQLKGLKNFLNDFSNIKDRSAIEVNLWQEYLMYAQMFGIAEKVAKEFKRLYPDVVTDTSYDTIIFVHTMSYHSYSSANSARSRAQSYSAGGGGFSAGGGGGGSFGGGGGGGGFR